MSSSSTNRFTVTLSTPAPATRALSRLRFRLLLGGLVLSLWLGSGCGPKSGSTPGDAGQPATGKPTLTGNAAALFANVTAQAGIRFEHTNGAQKGRTLFPETMPAGCAFLDYDNDGWLDILLIQSGTLTPDSHSIRPHCALYHNNRDGTFTDVTAGSGLDRDLGYGQGVAIGDYDNDGYDDIFITSYNHNHLLHNERGTGKFRDVTHEMGLDGIHSTGYATSATFGDYDNDGRLDLYVCYYCPWTLAGNKICHDARGQLDYCSPDVYGKDTHVLYHNAGNRFVDVSHSAGIDRVVGRGLAVAFWDYDEDGRQDIFVANDLSGNMLWHNTGRGKFVEQGAVVGCRYGDAGTLMAGMGIGIADYDHSGHESLFVTNFQDMPNMLFKNTGQGYVEDKTVFSHVGPLHQAYLSFGCEFIDYDADGWPDILTANGHVNMRGGEFASMKEAKQLLHNAGDGTFSEIRDPAALGDLARPTIARGLAVGDFDNDGRQDALFSNDNEAPQLLRNLDQSPHHWIAFKTLGTRSNRDGLHARFYLTVGGKVRVASVRAGSSYLSVSDRRVYFGLGDATRIDKVEVRWPSGIREELKPAEVDHYYLVTEGRGITRRLPQRGDVAPSPLHTAANTPPTGR